MVLPNFLGVGAEKAGTTPLFQILRQHRDVFIPTTKELCYFSRFYNWQPLEWYEGYTFKNYGGQRAIGEITPEYMRFPGVPKRIFEALGPEVKLIFCLRDPVRRAYSHYLMCCRLLEETESFDTAIALEPQRLAEDSFFSHRRSYIGGSRYAAQIERFLEFFPLENMFFMLFESDFLHDRAASVARLFAFLGVEPAEPVELNVPNNGLRVPRVIEGSARKTTTMVWKNGQRQVRAGDFYLSTDNRGLDTEFVRASPRAAAHLTKLGRNMTTTLSEERARALYGEFFSADVDRLEVLLKRDLRHWRPA